MLKVEDLKRDILKESGIERDSLPAVREAKRQVQALKDQLVSYQKHVEGVGEQIANLDKEIQSGLATGGVSVDKKITDRSTLREKKAALESLSIEVEDVMLPAAEAALDNAARKLLDALQLAVSLRHNAIQDELNSRLAVIEADLRTWTDSVYAVHTAYADLLPTSVPSQFSASTIALKNGTMRRALGF